MLYFFVNYFFYVPIYKIRIMKKLSIIILLVLITPLLFSLELEQFKNDQYVLDSLLEKIEHPCAPLVTGDYIIFTANPDIRHTGIAFDFEEYKIIHTFKNLIRENLDSNNTESDAAFYILKIPQNITSINYRLVMSGLWTTDPLNNNTVYDKKTNLNVSNIIINRPTVIESNTHNNTAYFVYEGASGQKIHLAGDFTNWDPFIYELKETKVGLYELEIPLPKGTYYYTYYSGINSFTDNTNPHKVYTKDGKVASVLTIN